MSSPQLYKNFVVFWAFQSLELWVKVCKPVANFQHVSLQEVVHAEFERKTWAKFLACPHWVSKGGSGCPEHSSSPGNMPGSPGPHKSCASWRTQGLTDCGHLEIWCCGWTACTRDHRLRVGTAWPQAGSSRATLSQRPQCQTWEPDNRKVNGEG